MTSAQRRRRPQGVILCLGIASENAGVRNFKMWMGGDDLPEPAVSNNRRLAARRTLVREAPAVVSFFQTRHILLDWRMVS